MPEKNYLELIATYLSGEISPEAQKELEAWRKKDTLNEQLFSEAEQIWETTANLKQDFYPDINEALKRLKKQIEKTNTPERKIIPLAQWLKIAAAVVFLFGIGYMLKIMFTDSNPDSDKIIAQNIKQIEIQSTDSALNFYLPDSSKVWLNTHSRLAYSENFADTARIIHLNGEGYFEVVHSEKPFIVMSGKYFVRVVGTSFNIRATDENENIEVNVYSGEVEFNQQDNSSEPVRIKKDETLTYNKTTGNTRKQKSKSQNKWWKKTSGKLKKFLKEAEKDFRRSMKKK